MRRYFAIRYRNKSGSFEYGIIKYFVNINNFFLVAINKFEIIGNSVTNIDGRTCRGVVTLKKKGVFNQFFSEVREVNKLLFIDALNIISKCIIGRTNKENVYLITEFTIENEHE
jgi:hypothetical protein